MDKEERVKKNLEKIKKWQLGKYILLVEEAGKPKASDTFADKARAVEFAEKLCKEKKVPCWVARLSSIRQIV